MDAAKIVSIICVKRRGTRCDCRIDHFGHFEGLTGSALPGEREFICAEGNSWVIIGQEGYYLSAEGFLMPTRKDQPPPDTRYFNEARH
jgi:hypothetical protein